MRLTRRQFLKSLAALGAAAALPIPAFASRRKPYVTKGEVVSYVGPHPGGFCGGRVVTSVGEWDGVGYPVMTHNNCYGQHAGEDMFYDCDLCNFRRELPPNFWADKERKRRYNNVHTWIVEKRFVISGVEAIKRLNFTHSDEAIRMMTS